MTMAVPQYAYAPARRPVRRVQGITALVYGPAKAGKSSLGDSGPRPRLCVDIEGTVFWTPSRKIYWNPMSEPVPQADGSWDTCVAVCRDAPTIHQVYKVLNSGRHPFRSASLDSVTEFQQRIIDDLVGYKKVDRDSWGVLLRQVSWATRQWRDLITHPTAPLWTVTFVAGQQYDREMSKWRPLVQGAVGNFLPYYVDVLGYIWPEQDGRRFLLSGPSDRFETGERVGGRLPPVMPIGYDDPAVQRHIEGFTMETMLAQVLAGRF